MNRYEVTYKKTNKQNPHIPATTIITVTDKETGAVQCFSKSLLTRGYQLEYNQELCDALFAADDMLYKRFPIEFRTVQMTDDMVRRYYDKFYEYYLPSHRVLDISREYARHTGSHLLYVPEEQIDQGMCDMYAYANPGLLGEIPEKFMKDCYLDFIINKYHLGLVPIEYRTVDVCLRFINASQSNIKFVPDEVLPEVCERLGLNHSEGLNLGKDDFWMKRKVIDRNGEIYIKKD